MEAAEKNLIFLYCVTKKAPKLKGVGNLVDELYFVYHLGLYAVVSKVKESEFSEENLKAMMDKHLEDFKTNLRNLKNKEEWGVKIYRDIERLKGTVIHEESGILKIEKEINSSSSGKAYFLKKKKEELMKEAVNKRINEYGQESFELFKILSYEARINKLLPKEVTEKEDDMVLNSAFLVDKDKVSEFIHAVDDLKTKYNDKGLNLDCTGPWPPYNFCNLSKGKEQSG